MLKRTTIACFILPLALYGCGQETPTSVKDSTAVADVASLKKIAEAGDPDALLAYGKELAKGGKPDDNLAALDWFRKAADAGKVEAMVWVAECYEQPNCAPIDEQESKKWWRRAADAGDPEGMFRRGLEYGIPKRDHVEIVGDSPEERERNAKLMLQLLEKSAEKGLDKAQGFLGFTYLFGVPGAKDKPALIPQDHAKAIPLLRAAADAGFPLAQWYLAIVYQYGFGVTAAEPAEAEALWAKLEKQTDPHAQQVIGSLYLVEGSKDYVTGKNKWRDRRLTAKESNELAIEWLERSARQGDMPAVRALGKLYSEGKAVAQDKEKGFSYYRDAAEKGDPEAQIQVLWSYLAGSGTPLSYQASGDWAIKVIDNKRSTRGQVAWAQSRLAILHRFGFGVDKDEVLAYAWANLAAAGLDSTETREKNANLLKEVATEMTPAEIVEAQRLSAAWSPGKELRREASSATVDGKAAISNAPEAVAGSTLKRAITGSGIVLSQRGQILTNKHVVLNCKEVRLPLTNNKAKIVVDDQANDLAVLEPEGDFNVAAGVESGVFAAPDSVKQGEDIVAFGFPLEGYLPASGNITQGIVSALAGPLNNSSILQITAPVQQGNSGGPVLNMKGQVVGVVVAKVDAIKVAKATGDVPQNINFAVAGRVVQGFLDGNRIDYRKAGVFSLRKDTAKLADEARKFTVKVECWR